MLPSPCGNVRQDGGELAAAWAVQLPPAVSGPGLRSATRGGVQAVLSCSLLCDSCSFPGSIPPPFHPILSLLAPRSKISLQHDSLYSYHRSVLVFFLHASFKRKIT